MKLRELKVLVDRAVETSRDYEDQEVMIQIKMPYTTVGAMPMVPVKGAYKGFDWEQGKYYFVPEENLTLADRDFAAQMRKMQEDLGWAKNENRNLKAEIKKLKEQLGK
jgi:hypothetical protein